MNRRRLRTAGAIVALIPLGIAWPVLAQQHDDVQRAKEMAQLIAAGQLNLRDATALAERHVKGTALEAMCNVQGGGPTKPEEGGKPGKPDKGDKPGKPGGPADESGQEIAGKRLIYEITCFADERIQTVRVDGQAKRVIDAKPQGSLGGATKP